MKTQKTHHALVVGAEAPLQRLFQETLHRAGFSAYSVGGGSEMFQTLAATPIDVVLLNTLRPGMDGFSLCATLRQASDVPILLVLKQGSTEEIVRGFELGADDYLCQPFEPLDLLLRIQAVLRRTAWQALLGRAPMLSHRRVDLPAVNPWGMLM